jgi:hypothetical protein
MIFGVSYEIGPALQVIIGTQSKPFLQHIEMPSVEIFSASPKSSSSCMPQHDELARTASPDNSVMRRRGKQSFGPGALAEANELGYAVGRAKTGYTDGYRD